MGFRRSDLQPAFSVPGDHRFTVWGYGTTYMLDEVLRPAYVQGGRSMLTLGDLIYVTTRPRRRRPDEPERGEVRVALVMVSAWDRGDATLRMVQDFGRPDDAGAKLRAGPPAPAAEAPEEPAPPRSAQPKPAKASAPRRSRPSAEPTAQPPLRKRGSAGDPLAGIPLAGSPHPAKPAKPAKRPKNQARMGG